MTYVGALEKGTQIKEKCVVYASFKNWPSVKEYK